MAALSSAADYKTAMLKVLTAQQKSAHGIEPESWVRHASLSDEHKLQILSELNTYKMALGSRIHQPQTQDATP